MKIIIAGGRDFNNYGFVKGKLDELFSAFNQESRDNFEIVSGGARGVDALGERYARESGYRVKLFPYLSQYGKAGGPMRNKQMAEYADTCICFWDGKSAGTKSMIELAKKEGLWLHVYLTEQAATPARSGS